MQRSSNFFSNSIDKTDESKSKYWYECTLTTPNQLVISRGVRNGNSRKITTYTHNRQRIYMYTNLSSERQNLLKWKVIVVTLVWRNYDDLLYENTYKYNSSENCGLESSLQNDQIDSNNFYEVKLVIKWQSL